MPLLKDLHALLAILGDLRLQADIAHQPLQQQRAVALVFGDQNAIGPLPADKAHDFALFHLLRRGWFGQFHRQVHPE